jgi:transposase
MPNKRKSMKQIRKIIEMSLSDRSFSIREISRATGISRPTVSEYLQKIQDKFKTPAEIEGLNDTELKKALDIQNPVLLNTEENGKLIDWLTQNISRLNQRNYTRLLLHEDYIGEVSHGLSYSQFCFVISQVFQEPKESGLLSHVAGDKLYIDYTGQKLHWKDESGLSHKEEIFLAVLGASGFLFSQPSPSQKQEDLGESLENCFWRLGGVPRAVVPDALKSAVIKNDPYDPMINSHFQKIMDHYGSICLPARSRRPKDKALVEASVKLVYHRILARLKDKVFRDRDHLLTWWQEQVDRINEQAFQKLPGSRRSRFDEIDSPALGSLPEQKLDLVRVLNQQVVSTGVVFVPQDQTSYSVPFSLQGCKIEALVYSDSIEIWHENQLKALHKRQPGAGKVILKEHLPPDHRWYEHKDLDELIRTLRFKGNNMDRYMEEVQKSHGHEEQTWKYFRGLLKLADQYPLRIDAACRIALREKSLRLDQLKKILREEIDIQMVSDEEKNFDLPFHENVRGPEYYLQREALS